MTRISRGGGDAYLYDLEGGGMTNHTLFLHPELWSRVCQVGK
jgi:hypothetical protein